MEKKLKEDFKQTIERLKKLEGKVRGCCLKSMVDAIIGSENEKYLPDIQQKLGEYGFQEDLRKISALKWYPISFIIASLFSFYEILNWKEEDVRAAGRNCPRSSAQIIFRLSVQISISFEKVFGKLNYFWGKLVSFGKLEGIKLNEQERVGIARITDFSVHRLYCVFIEGFGEAFGKMLVKGQEVTVRETKCSLKGDPYHEFLIKW